MKEGAHIDGFPEVMRNLNKEINKIKGATMQGLIRGAIIIRRDMDMTPPLIPIDLGNLRASWFISTFQTLESTPAFKGPKGGEMAAEHATAVTESIGQAGAVGGRGLSLIMGFSANYAMFVHENLNANFGGHPDKIKRTKAGKATGKSKKFSRRSGAGPKFFEYSVKRNSGKVLEVIAKSAKIK